MIRQFVSDIERLLSSIPNVLSSDFQKHFDPLEQSLYLKGTVTFIDASVLNIALFLVQTGKKIQFEKYRYQYMDSKGEMHFRYDNAKHYPELRTFPHHKHVRDMVKETTMPGIEDIINEISAIILGRQKSQG